MKTNMLLPFAGILLMVFFSCNAQESAQKLDAEKFSNKLANTANAVLLDVRTPEEFSKGHLRNAINIDWNQGNHFTDRINNLSKDKPVFVYCLSGGRSGAAAKLMRSAGFKQVYELEGGILKWRSAGLPEVNSLSGDAGMSKEQFESLKGSAKTVLVDFYADWCEPCKKMAPFLNEIKQEMPEKVTVIRINVEDNKQLMKALHIDELPVLILYQNKREVWKRTEYTTKEDMVAHINSIS